MLRVTIVVYFDDCAIFGERIKSPFKNIIISVHIDGDMEILTIDNLDGLVMLSRIFMEIDFHGPPGCGVAARSYNIPSSPRRNGCFEISGDVVASLIVGIISAIRCPSAWITAKHADFTLNVDWSVRLSVTAENLLYLFFNLAGRFGDGLRNVVEDSTGAAGAGD